MGDSGSGYQPGSGETELARLEFQGTALALATWMIFAAAGLRRACGCWTWAAARVAQPSRPAAARCAHG